jgi:phosphoribosylaminoimidazolecarboxamide formyltransferase/IMP cyclohydrolase
MLKARRALVSVSNKEGVAELARGLEKLGVEILSTGGTARYLEEAGIPVLQVSQATGSPEILDGRVKTLHPAIHGGILADRGRASHLAQLREHDIVPIDIVAVNLYPFRETAEKEGASVEEIVEMIDVGGPCMLRAAAKNYRGVLVVVDPDDYPQVLAALEEGEGVVPEALRQRLALKAFRHTQAYDTAIAAWLERQTASPDEPLPPRLHLDLERVLEPRYGENPHQAAAVYRTVGSDGLLAGVEQLQGKELSWNNLLDVDAARKLVSQFEEQPTIAIVKHNNPCGVGRGATLAEAYERALASDPVSAFGSIVATNRQVDAALAEAMKDLFVEVILAPGFDEDAVRGYTAKKNLRLLRAPLHDGNASAVELRSIDGGFLAQVADGDNDDPESWTCPTKKKPTAKQREALVFAWSVARYVKSNAIVLATAEQTVGVGAGQMSRLDSCRLAIDKARAAGLETKGTVAASDAFFPFRDGLDVLAKAGVKAVVQPGGSRRDKEVVAAADEHKVAMLFSGTRHFRH